MKAKYLHILVRPRYQEDAIVDGAHEHPYGAPPRMPGMANGTLELMIDLDLCRVAYWPPGTTARTHYKVCDDGDYKLLDESCSPVEKHSGYVPREVSPGGMGDYLELVIDADGKVYEWTDGMAWAWRPGRFRHVGLRE